MATTVIFMTAFEKYFGNAYDLVDVLKSTEKSFVALIYDKNAKRLCVMKERNLQSLNLYKILRELDNPHVPKIFRLIEREDKLIVIEEHIDGQTLDELANYRREILTEQFVGDIFMQICDALIPLHEQNIIHRDLTPSNIMLTEKKVVKLIDFGIARIFKPDSSADTEFLGTRGYAAPEQLGVFELGQTDVRTDIFILGMTVKNLLGKNYGGRLEKVLSRCTDLNPAMRWQSVPDLIHAVKRARKLWLLKRFGLTAATACTIFFAAQFISFESPVNESPPEKISATVTNEQSPPQNDDVAKSESTPALNSELTDPLIDFVKNPPPADKVEVPAINVEPLPSVNRPAPKTQPQPQPVRHAKRPKLYLYLNGKLTENHGEHTTLGTVLLDDDYKNWQRNDKGDYLFPANWTARLHIENFTATDLITPQITVSFTREKISFDIPNILAGQTRDVDIPIAGRSALKVLGADNIHGELVVGLKSSSDVKIPLLERRLEVKK